MGDDQSSGAAHGSKNGLAVPRPQRSQINDLDADILLVEDSGGFERDEDRLRPSDDRDIATFARDPSPTDLRWPMVGLVYLSACPPKLLMLKMDDWVVASDRSFE